MRREKDSSGTGSAFSADPPPLGRLPVSLRQNKHINIQEVLTDSLYLEPPVGEVLQALKDLLVLSKPATRYSKTFPLVWRITALRLIERSKVEPTSSK